MIRVTIELVPLGILTPRHLGTIEIHNDLLSDRIQTRGNYLARLSPRSRPQQVWKTATVTDFPRKRLGAYDLLYRVLRDAVGDRND